MPDMVASPISGPTVTFVTMHRNEAVVAPFVTVNWELWVLQDLGSGWDLEAWALSANTPAQRLLPRSMV